MSVFDMLNIIENSGSVKFLLKTAVLIMPDLADL